MATTKERWPMAMSISAVAAICAPAPSITQGQKLKDGRGSGTPVTSKTPIKDSNANGKRNRKRTWVAPTVPRLVVSSRCIALRKVWKNAAVTVKTIQSQEDISFHRFVMAELVPAIHDLFFHSEKTWMPAHRRA